MSTKKEKCRCCDGECNHDACCGKIEENCATNCPCHQSESIEWEKFAEKVSENFDSIYRKFPANEAAVIIRNRIKNSFPSLISQAITTAVAKRDAYLVDNIGKLISQKKTSVHDFSYNLAIDDVLSLFIKH